MSEQIISKRCPNCKDKEIKSLTEFNKNKGSKDGRQALCKICQRTRQRAYQKTERGKASQKRYRQSEKGEKARNRFWQSEKGRNTRKWYRETKEGKTIHQRAISNYKKRHPERIEAHKAVKYAIRTGKLPRPDSLKCHYCPAQANDYHHHKGYAPEYFLDVVPACVKCHKKHPN